MNRSLGHISAGAPNCVEHQVRAATCREGLVFFAFPSDDSPEEAKREFADWRLYPHLSVSIDQGSDGVAAAHALMYGMSVNMSLWCDPSHGVHRDIGLMLRGCQIYRLWLLLMIAMNVQHGPFEEDMRYQQMQECLEQVWRRFTPADCPLWEEKADEIAEELLGNEPVEEAYRSRVAWDRARDAGLLQKKGYRVNLNRFMGSIAGARELLQRWSSLSFAVSYVCLELDMLGSRQFLEKALLQDPGGDLLNDRTTSTDPKIASAPDKMLRSCCQNSMAITAIVLDDRKNKQITLQVTKVSEPSLRWHSEQNVENRDVHRSREWVFSQVANRKFMDHVNATLGVLASETALAECGFRLRSNGLDADTLDMHIALDDEAACLFGRLAMTLAALRMRRCLWMISSWPSGFVSMLGSADQASATLRLLREDFLAFEGLRRIPDPSSSMRAMMARSVFNLVAVKQVVTGCAELGWVMHPDLRRVVEPRFQVLVGTQVCEDALNYQKNHGVLRGTRRFRRPQRSYCAILEKPLLDGQHRFESMVPDIPMPSKTCALQTEVFKPTVKGQSMAFNTIEGTTASPAWWSPSATNISIPAADLPVLRTCERKHDYRLLDYLWLGALFDSAHQVVFRFKADGSLASRWYFGLYHFPGSGLLVWPGRAHRFAGGGRDEVCFRPDVPRAPPL